MNDGNSGNQTKRDPIKDDKDVRNLLYAPGGIFGPPRVKIVAVRTVVKENRE